MNVTRMLALPLALQSGWCAEAGRDWSVYLGSDERSHYSTLAEVNAGNVHRLEVAWTYRSGDFKPDMRKQIQCNPLVIGGVLYGTTATNGQLKMNWPNKVLKGDTSPGFTIDLAHKDLSLIVDAANAAKVPMPMAAAAREAFSAARASGFGGQDFSAMVDVLCTMAGIEKPRFRK